MLTLSVISTLLFALGAVWIGTQHPPNVGTGDGGVVLVTPTNTCVPPAFTAPPVATAAAGMSIGDTFETTDGTYVGTGVVVTYQWLRDGVPIGGATASTYVLTNLDIGPLITPEVTLTGTCGVASDVGNDLQYDYAASYALGGQDPAFGFDTADASTIGADVDSIPDAFPNGNVESAAGLANRPLFNAADPNFNNQPTMTCDPAGPEYLRAVATVTGGDFPTWTMLMVASVQAATAARRMLDYGNATIHMRMTSAAFVQGLNGASLSQTTTSLLASPQLVQYFGVSVGNQEIGVGGVTQDTDAGPGSTRAANLTMSTSASPTGAAPGAGTYAFCAMLRASISASVLATFTAYCQYRWGVP